MEVLTINDTQVKKEFYNSTEKLHVITCWLGIILNLLWFISDIYVLPDHWFSFFIFRLSISTITLVLLLTKKYTTINIYTILFLLVLGISIQNAFMWSVMNIEHFQKHAFAYMVLFIGVGMLILWEIWYSLIILIATVLSNIIFYKINSQLSIQEFLINGGLLILTVSVFSVFMIRSRYRLTYNEIKSRLELKKSKEIIEEKHIEVVHQKKEITDSINYARNIQKSLIPDEKQFNSYFKDSFVLFKPKDIVSGDFYWITEKNNLVFYATADCTGHGVPGGFMTMLGLTFLSDIIDSKEIANPSEILNLLREKIISTLKQTGKIGDNKDGMDITLCCINKNNNELHYAAANNPLYIVKNPGKTNTELIICKADKQPCGFYHDIKAFTNFKIELSEGDCIYSFSDGFADQFGGPNGKKFMYKNFKEIIFENAHLSFAEQKNKLNASFKNWLGNQEQVDDVLVIGVKI